MCFLKIILLVVGTIYVGAQTTSKLLSFVLLILGTKVNVVLV